jgi:hypothetical protein
MCSWSRYLIVAAFAGVAGSSLSGSDPIGLLAAAVAVLVVLAAGRLFPTRIARSSCAMPVQQVPAPQQAPAARHDETRPEPAPRS